MRRAARGGIFALALLATPAFAQTYHLEFTEDCSRVKGPDYEEYCTGSRERKLRERLGKVGLRAAATAEKADHRLKVDVTLVSARAYMQELRPGGRRRNLSRTLVEVGIERNDQPSATRKFDLDSESCGIDVDDAPAQFVLASLAAADVRPAEIVRFLTSELHFPFAICGVDGTGKLLDTLRVVRAAVVPSLRPRLADRRYDESTAYVFGAFASGAAAAAVRARVESLTRAKAVGSLESAVRVGTAYADGIQYVPAAEIEPEALDEMRAMIRVFDASPYTEQKRRFFAGGTFHDHLLEMLRKRLEPPDERR